MATYERKCRSCGKWSTLSTTETQACAFCHEPYGKIELGMDVLRKVDADEAVSTRPKKAKGWEEATKIPPPAKGEFGYVDPRRKS